jgi:HEAT repeat protein
MPIDRDEVIAALASFAVPLGPLTAFDERLDVLDRWVAQFGPDLLAVLASIIDAPPEPLPAPPGDWEVLVVAIASQSGSAHRDEALQHVVPLLDRPDARAIAVDILGAVGDRRAVPSMGHLLARHDLTEDERVRVAGALGDIGGEEACRLLREMRAATPATDRELQHEIDTAIRCARA